LHLDVQMNKKRWNENSSENIRTVKYPSGITFEALHLYHTYTQLHLFVLPGFCIHHKAFPVDLRLDSEKKIRKVQIFEKKSFKNWPKNFGPKYKISIFENGENLEKLLNEISNFRLAYLPEKMKFLKFRVKNGHFHQEIDHI